MALKMIGITDEVTTCTCCGRQNLKRTVVLDRGEGSFEYFGTACATKALHPYREYQLKRLETQVTRDAAALEFARIARETGSREIANARTAKYYR